jgi:L-fuconolactonase
VILKGGIFLKIDAHQHFWLVERCDYSWLTPERGILYRDYLPHDLTPLLQENQIDYTVVVQAAPTIAETEYLLDLYEKNESIAGVVGWIDLASVDFKVNFKRLLEHPGFVGLRPMLQDLKDDRWILQPQVKENIHLLLEADFPLDILIYPRHLSHILELLDEFPTLRGVIDHCAKPQIKDKEWQPWADEMAKAAKYENIMCKLSGLITEADHQSWKLEEIASYIQHVIQVFGTDRVMFGSDWPVCLLAGDYGDVYQTLLASLPKEFDETAHQNILGQNAVNFYKLNVRRAPEV